MAIGGKRKAKNYQVERCEARLPMQVGVRISGNTFMPGLESTFTENVSFRGACVRSVRRWRIGESICVLSPSEGFRSLARVAYCEPSPAGYAIGVEFLELEGQWVLASAS
ncbi:MAG TPA: PilZ domain-containing protein [Candidatus Acidoferrales bacterium]|nr:PilZ domain-containing protein [Candidatus Acidoferrales bacterium]